MTLLFRNKELENGHKPSSTTKSKEIRVKKSPADLKLQQKWGQRGCFADHIPAFFFKVKRFFGR